MAELVMLAVVAALGVGTVFWAAVAPSVEDWRWGRRLKKRRDALKTHPRWLEGCSCRNCAVSAENGGQRVQLPAL
jgi:hypothetical protein